MTKHKIIALTLLVVGIGLIFWGYDLSDSLESKLSRTLNGSNTDEVMLFYIGGAVCIVVGAYLFLKNKL